MHPAYRLLLLSSLLLPALYPQTPANQLSQLQSDVERLRQQAATAEASLARTQQLLLFLAGVGALYAIAQGYLASKAMDRTLKQAEEELKSAREQFKELRSDLKTDFSQLKLEVETQLPAIAGLDQRIQEALKNVDFKILLNTLGTYRRGFANLSPDEHARIENLELYLPLLTAFRHTSEDKLLKFHLGLSAYFLSKANTLRGAANPILPDATSAIARSRYHLERAEALAPQDQRVLNEKVYRLLHDSGSGFLLGFLLSEPERTRLAKDYLQQSLQKFPHQKRGLIWAAYFADEAGKYSEAQALLNKALQTKAWEDDSDAYEKASDAHNAVAYYNLACACAKEAKKQRASAPMGHSFAVRLEEKALLYLEARAKIIDEDIVAELAQDLAKGDLVNLNTPEYAQRLAAIHAALALPFAA